MALLTVVTDLKHGEKTVKCSDTRNRCVHGIHSLLLGLPIAKYC
jgi:hypothetical protein